MKKAHNVAKFKEKCEICGVRFINLQAHKEKYHYFVDVDKCSLCGKVSLLWMKNHSMPIFLLGSEVLIIPPLPTAAGQCGQGE